MASTLGRIPSGDYCTENFERFELAFILRNNHTIRKCLTIA